MNQTNIDDEYEDYNAEALQRTADDLRDHIASGRDHAAAALRDLRRCIEIVVNARLDKPAMITGRSLDDILETLCQIEGDLVRADGELADADPHS